MDKLNNCKQKMTLDKANITRAQINVWVPLCNRFTVIFRAEIFIEPPINLIFRTVGVPTNAN